MPEPSEGDYIRQERLEQKRRANLTALRGAQQKAKWIPTVDWDRLLQALSRSDSRWAQPAVWWIVATLLTGLRPCEWRSARLLGTQLQVTNAKATNGRAHSPARTIDLSRLPPDQLKLIEGFVDTVAGHGSDGYQELYDGVRNLIRLQARRAFAGRKQYPTLYTARHCFAARAKSTFSRTEVAALMGHASIATAARHYAAAGFARDGRPLEVEPTAADVEAVRRAQAARGFLDSMDGVHRR